MITVVAMLLEVFDENNCHAEMLDNPEI